MLFLHFFFPFYSSRAALIYAKNEKNKKIFRKVGTFQKKLLTRTKNDDIMSFAALSEGVTTVFNAGRLRDKESDRIQSTVKLINDLGGEASETEDGLVIKGKGRLRGGKIDAMNDHRIAMAAAVAACGCLEEVTVMGAECVSKSYPDFWRDFEALEVKGE